MTGKVKATGDALMYPQPLLDLSGWSLRSLSAGPSGFAASSDVSTITWGGGTNGENGFATGPKTSVAPKKVETLEGYITRSVACGAGFNLFVVDEAPNEEGKPTRPKLEALPVFEPPEDAPPAPPAGKGGKGKGPAAAAPAAKKGKAKK